MHPPQTFYVVGYVIAPSHRALALRPLAKSRTLSRSVSSMWYLKVRERPAWDGANILHTTVIVPTRSHLCQGSRESGQCFRQRMTDYGAVNLKKLFVACLVQSTASRRFEVKRGCPLASSTASPYDPRRRGDGATASGRDRAPSGTGQSSGLPHCPDFSRSPCFSSTWVHISVDHLRT
jgi:hypothetical protein